MGRCHPGSAVDPDGLRVTDTECREPGVQQLPGQEVPVAVQVLPGRRADRARDVPRARVDRLHLAAVTLRRAGVEQDARASHPGGVVGVEHRQVSRGEHDVSGYRDALAGLELEAGLPPGVQGAVEDAHVVHSRPAQQPPRPGCRLSPVVVVDHDRPPGGQPPVPGRPLQCLDVGERMPSGGPARRRGELGVEVDVDRARQVTVTVVVTAMWIAESPADVEQQRRCGRQQFVMQLLGVDEDRRPAGPAGIAAPIAVLADGPAARPAGFARARRTAACRAGAC